MEMRRGELRIPPGGSGGVWREIWSWLFRAGMTREMEVCHGRADRAALSQPIPAAARPRNDNYLLEANGEKKRALFDCRNQGVNFFYRQRLPRRGMRRSSQRQGLSWQRLVGWVERSETQHLDYAHIPNLP